MPIVRAKNGIKWKGQYRWPEDESGTFEVTDEERAELGDLVAVDHGDAPPAPAQAQEPQVTHTRGGRGRGGR